MLLAAGVAATPVFLWATNKAAFTEDGVELRARGRRDVVRPDAARTRARAVRRRDRLHALRGSGSTCRPTPGTRSGRCSSRVLSLVALAGVGAVALSDRGLDGHDLRPLEGADRRQRHDRGRARPAGHARPRRAAATGGRRSTSSRTSRSRASAPAGSPRRALRYRETLQLSRHAHGYVVQTLADLGVIGPARCRSRCSSRGCSPRFAPSAPRRARVWVSCS